MSVYLNWGHILSAVPPFVKSLLSVNGPGVVTSCSGRRDWLSPWHPVLWRWIGVIAQQRSGSLPSGRALELQSNKPTFRALIHALIHTQHPDTRWTFKQTWRFSAACAVQTGWFVRSYLPLFLQIQKHLWWLSVDQMKCMLLLFLRGQTMPSSIVNRVLKLNMSNVFLPLVLDQLQTVKRRRYVLRCQVLWTWNTWLHCWTVKGGLLGSDQPTWWEPVSLSCTCSLSLCLSLLHVLSLSMSLSQPNAPPDPLSSLTHACFHGDKKFLSLTQVVQKEKRFKRKRYKNCCCRNPSRLD